MRGARGGNYYINKKGKKTYGEAPKGRDSPKQAKAARRRNEKGTK